MGRNVLLRHAALLAASLYLALCERQQLLLIADHLVTMQVMLIKDIIPNLEDRDEPRSAEKRARSEHWWTTVVPALSEKHFKRTFRVSRRVFNNVVNAVKGEPEFYVAPNNALRAIPVEKQVAIALWRLGRSASVYDVADQFGVSEAAVVAATRRTHTTIRRTLSSKVTSLWPDTPAKCAALAEDFRRLAGMEGCVAALDGTLLPIWRPAGTIDEYWCRKQFHALNFQVAVDARYRILYVGGGVPGAAWDGSVVAGLGLMTHMVPALPEGYFIVADSGYNDHPRMVLPFKRKSGQLELPPLKRRFNYLHSLTRGVVEKVFGVLKARFRWMLKGVPMADPSHYVEAFIVACILHNMCIEDQDSEVVAEDAGDEDFQGLAGDRHTDAKVRANIQAYAQEAMANPSAKSTAGQGGAPEPAEEDAVGDVTVKEQADALRLSVLKKLLAPEIEKERLAANKKARIS